MKNKIINIASELFEEEVNETTKIGDIEAWDSLGQLNLFMAIESELNISCTPDEIIESDSIEKISALINNKIN